MINTHQNTSLQTVSKHNRKNVCDCDQKYFFTTSKGIITMKCTIDVLNNVMTLRNDQEHLKHVKWLKVTLDD